MTDDQLERIHTPDARSNPTPDSEERILVHLNTSRLKEFMSTKWTKHVLLKCVAELDVRRTEHGDKAKVHIEVLSLSLELLPATVCSWSREPKVKTLGDKFQNMFTERKQKMYQTSALL